MIEIRWLVFGPNKELEYRHRIFAVDASGALCPTLDWSDWKRVETVEGDQASYEDLQKSGGLVFD